MNFENPMLLSVKMFLAEVRSWKYDYKFPDYICTNFALEVFYKATLNGMRCGYTVVTFEESQLAHALVAFDTDYGLIYIEPQSGSQERVAVGRPYPIQMEGVPKESLVSGIQIAWNDEDKITFLECVDCGCLVPIQCPACKGAQLKSLEME